MFAKNLKTNQNAGCFKLQYLTKNLRYEVEFLDMARGPRKPQILVGCFKWMCSGTPEYAQSDKK